MSAFSLFRVKARTTEIDVSTNMCGGSYWKTPLADWFSLCSWRMRKDEIVFPLLMLCVRLTVLAVLFSVQYERTWSISQEKFMLM